jgi:hypothetical protein
MVREWKIVDLKGKSMDIEDRDDKSSFGQPRAGNVMINEKTRNKTINLYNKTPPS